MEQSRVNLPAQISPPFEVYVNGVVQTEGVDFEYREGALLFDRPLGKEGKLGFWRWFIGAFGIGTYRRHDAIDVSYELDGRRLVAHALDIEPAMETSSAPSGPT